MVKHFSVLSPTYCEAPLTRAKIAGTQITAACAQASTGRKGKRSTRSPRESEMPCSNDIKNRTTKGRVCGPACTVQVYPRDNLMVHQALDVAQPGDVVVVYAGNSMNGVMGDMIAVMAAIAASKAS